MGKEQTTIRKAIEHAKNDWNLTKILKERDQILWVDASHFGWLPMREMCPLSTFRSEEPKITMVMKISKKIDDFLVDSACRGTSKNGLANLLVSHWLDSTMT